MLTRSEPEGIVQKLCFAVVGDKYKGPGESRILREISGVSGGFYSITGEVSRRNLPTGTRAIVGEDRSLLRNASDA
jgi:hypothetical protein